MERERGRGREIETWIEREKGERGRGVEFGLRSSVLI